MGSPDRPSKHQAFLALLQEGWTSLHLDARRDGVVVPVNLKDEGHLVLQYGNDLPIPITDLVVNDEGVYATLSFSRSPHQTVVPWSAVYVIATEDGRGVLYHEDIPSDVAVVPTSTDAERPGLPNPSVAAQPLLETASSDDAGPGGDDAFVPAAPSTPPRRTLRSIPLDGAAAPEAEPLPDIACEPAEPTPAASSSSSPTAPGARRRRKPQLRLVK